MNTLLKLIRIFFPFAFMNYHNKTRKQRETYERLEDNFYFRAWQCVGQEYLLIPSRSFTLPTHGITADRCSASNSSVLITITVR